MQNFSQKAENKFNLKLKLKYGTHLITNYRYKGVKFYKREQIKA